MILGILVLGLALRLVLSPFWTQTSDMGLWTYWGDSVGRIGFDGLFDLLSWSDYLPFYFYVLFLSHKATLVFATLPPTILYKLPSILADIGTAWFLYKIAGGKRGKLGILAAALYIFNPAIFMNSSLWGQVDGIGALFLVACVSMLLQKKYIAGGLILGLALTFKPIFVIALPVFLVWLVLASKGGAQKFLFAAGKFFGSIFLSMWAVCLPFVKTQSLESITSFVTSPFLLLLDRYQIAISQYPYTSVNAFNFWAIGNRWWQSDFTDVFGIAYRDWGIIFITVSLGLSVLFFLKSGYEKTQKHAVTLVFFVIFMALFSFATRAHERHMLTALPFLALLAVESYGYFALYALLSLSYFLNLYFALEWLLQGGRFVFGWGVINILSVFNTLVPLFFLCFFFWVIVKKPAPVKSVPAPGLSLLGKFWLEKKVYIVVFFFVFLVASRFFRTWYPGTFYFDEVYHAFTARELVRGNPAAWEYWATPPQGFAYEWTHPPMAKIIMAGGILIFGQNSFGWRLPGVVFGIVAIFLVWCLGKHLFKKDLPAVFAVILFSLDGLPFVMSRIGMNDIYFLVFALGAILFFLKSKYFWSALFLGLAIATKWTAFFAIPILGVAWILYKRRVEWGYFWYFVLLPLIYFASYLIFFTSGHTLVEWWQTQQQMWWYHTGLVATHPYSSPWWSWPIMEKPVWLYVANLGSQVANIYASGNPIIFWGGLASVVSSVVVFVKRRDRALFFLIVSYLGFFLPWAFSPRIMFLYHYLPSIPFMVLLLGWLLAKIWESKKEILVIGYLALVLLVFILYYPLWTGIPVPSWWNTFLL